MDVHTILSLLSRNENKAAVRTVKNNTDKHIIPVMTNKVPLPKGTELVFQKAEQKEKHEKAKQPTWLETASKEWQSEQKHKK